MYIANKQQSQCIPAARVRKVWRPHCRRECAASIAVSLFCLLSVVAWSAEALTRRDGGTIVLISLAWPLRDCAQARLDSTPASSSVGASEVQGQAGQVRWDGGR